MGFSQISLLVLILICFFNLGFGARKLTSLYQPPPMLLTYHHGNLLHGNLPVSILWYGHFTPSQKSIVADLLLSLETPQNNKGFPSSSSAASTPRTPSVSQWWKTLETYMKNAGKNRTQIVLTRQISDEKHSMGKTLTRSQVSELAHRVNPKPGTLTLVLTGKEVAVDGFCTSNCGFHGSNPNKNSAFIWVGNSVGQCPGQCAWPFHQPIYGPQGSPLGAPNGDVGLDGMIVNIASLLAGTVTNPFGDGYFQGTAEAPLEAVSACPGIYGRDAYPGYAGKVLMDTVSGASYNAHGANGRKYLLPAMFDPSTSSCSTIV